MAETTAAATAQTDTEASSEQTSSSTPQEETPETETSETTAVTAPPAETTVLTQPEITDFTLPEGFSLNADLTADMKAFAKEQGFDQEKAQKVADFGLRMLQQQQEVFEGMKTQWAEASKSDKEFGGDKLTENLGIAKKGMDSVATPEFIAFLNETGLGNHPEMIRAFYRVGKTLGEDKLVTGKGSPAAVPDLPEKRLFPNMA